MINHAINDLKLAMVKKWAYWFFHHSCCQPYAAYGS